MRRAKSALPRWRKTALLGLTLLALALALRLLSTFQSRPWDDELLVESTLGQLALWMAEQSGNDPEDIASPLAQYAADWASSLGAAALDPALPLNGVRQVIVSGCLLLIAILLLALFWRPARSQAVFFAGLTPLALMLFIVPASPAFSLILCAMLIQLTALLIAPGKPSRALGFFIALAALMLVWEGAKSLADALQYQIALPQPSWRYETRPSLDEALAALKAGELDAVIADRKDLDDEMRPHPPEADEAAEARPWPNLRYLDDLNRAAGLGPLPISPAFPGRLTIALRADEAEQVNAVSDIFGRDVAAVAGEFADRKFLPAPRRLILLDLKILNDLNLPHLQMIAEAFLQPARRNGEWLLLRILGAAGAYTFSEAIYGFILGALLGFALGAVFAHSALMERSLLPYVVASQTVPILAIAPMVVIWLGASQLSVAVIAAYLTFFPVTINTLRGLQSPDTAQIELMRSYASSRWTTMWKLRFPAALPYIFTALKVSATASVVGAIIGELPSGIGDGLGRAILDFSSDYSPISTPKLWASIVMAAAVGILFFLSVNLAERLLLRGYVRRLD